MYLVTADEMRKLDRHSIEVLGIPAAVLMDHAGKAVAREILNRFFRPGKAVVLSGTGNNGGDGWSAARHLRLAGWQVTAWLVGDEEKLTPESRIFHEVQRKLGPVKRYGPEKREELIRHIREADVVVDALLGTGAKGPLRLLMAEVVSLVNRHRRGMVVAADMPTGADADTGKVHAEAVRADLTVTFQYPKWGHFLRPGADFAGELAVADIGIIPPEPGSPLEPVSRINQPGLWREHLRRRDPWSHKGTYGHLLLIGGAAGMPGAVKMAAEAACRAGTGLVTLAVPESERQAHLVSAVQEMVWSWPGERTFSPGSAERFAERKDRFSAVAAGPGLGRFEGEETWLRGILKQVEVPILLDADALNILASHPGLMRLLSSRPADAPAVLTPHPGEMARLLGTKTDAVEADRPGSARRLAEKTGSIVVLKGRYTIIAFPDGRCILNTTGSPALAKAGSGDILTGVIGALLARGIPPERAVPMGVWLHGKAGEEAGPDHSVTYREVLEAIGRVLEVLSTTVPD